MTVEPTRDEAPTRAYVQFVEKIPEMRSILIQSMIVGLLWLFPRFWYERDADERSDYWFEESESLAGWRFEPVEVSETAERMLVADSLFSGTFHHDSGRLVRVFTARRHKEDLSEVGLFVHTPDRCWTEAGWRLLREEPTIVNIEIEGRTIAFERRVFEYRGVRELVYFGGLVAGESLPYRLDHNMSVGQRLDDRGESRFLGVLKRATDQRFWGRVFESFKDRAPLFGPKQFVRVSTPATPGSDEADEFLKDFLATWGRFATEEESE